MNLGGEDDFWRAVICLRFTCSLIVSTVAALPLFSSFLLCVCAHAALLSLNTDFLDVYAGYMCFSIKSLAMEYAKLPKANTSCLLHIH